MNREHHWRIMVEDGMPVEFRATEGYEHCKSTASVLGEGTEAFNVDSGEKHGCICPQFCLTTV
jgi:hypothetical protein